MVASGTGAPVSDTDKVGIRAGVDRVGDDGFAGFVVTVSAMADGS